MIVPTGFNRWLCHWIARSKKRARSYPLVGSEGDENTRRFEIFTRDEYPRRDGTMRDKLPWWQPFNVLLHQWYGSDTGHPHDHPRWTITIVLRGWFIEQHDGQAFVRRAGQIIVRSHKYAHRIVIPRGQARKVHTLFIVGRRKHQQHYYVNGQKVRVEDYH